MSATFGHTTKSNQKPASVTLSLDFVYLDLCELNNIGLRSICLLRSYTQRPFRILTGHDLHDTCIVDAKSLAPCTPLLNVLFTAPESASVVRLDEKSAASRYLYHGLERSMVECATNVELAAPSQFSIRPNERLYLNSETKPDPQAPLQKSKGSADILLFNINARYFREETKIREEDASSTQTCILQLGSHD
ncbi:hypothetical protein NA56DRAFT_713181 [Hyaloscypha hepaticicola]|uniref:Uncharacterized protein n=1 Tax=Hyaloscypha hepaticicola TaxID=2082293 RepID=A0A2J6PEE0_9HELO|nr:hypothetical protein NA56DRAFT_713181 [Hyaloscypha hepaticicola]